MRRNSTPYVVYIQWDDTHTSPPIGPFFYLTEMELFKRKARAELRRRGINVNGRVRSEYLASPERAESWLS